MERLAYTVKECAAAVGVSPRTITREIQRGRLRMVRIGRTVRIPAQALTQFLERVATSSKPVGATEAHDA